MKQAYIIISREDGVVLGVAKKESHAKAKAICSKHWMREFGVSFIEFCSVVSCRRCKDLDHLEFNYLDGTDLEGDNEIITIEDIERAIKLKNGKNKKE